MAVIDTPRAVGQGHGFFDRMAATFGMLVAWNDARVTRNALSKLSDHELDDIGLTRGSISDIR